ncbi:MAG: DUF3450 domain-containing protein [Maricaulaceae bacterium]|nr:DUF3450 domain-containing protein [Maricaulaceae bacterium]
MANIMKWVRASLAAAFTAGIAAGAAQAQLGQVLETAQQSTREGAAAQRQIDQLDDQRTDIELEYRALLQQIESQRLFVEQQRVFLMSQQNEITSLRNQLESVEGIGRDLLPMMREMVENLEDFVSNDLPFQSQTRTERVERLYGVLDDADITAAERYRLILNAYDIEAAYGRGVASYAEVIEVGGEPIEVRVLRIGRVILIRQMPGGGVMVRYRGASDWQPVSGANMAEIQRAFRIADEVTTPDVFLAPLPAPAAGR